MNNKLLYRVFGLVSFIVTLIVYSMTAQPNVPFWDCGEFTAASTWQQVPHPPGAPLFLMLGRLFQIIIPFGDLGWRVNMVSVVATAFSVWLLYFIIVKVIVNFRKSPVNDISEAITVYGSALVGALAFCFSDTIWFNGVESEVYAMSTLFTALVVFLMMKWNEEADTPGHERYLLLIAYIVGLSTGVHLLAILTVFSIVMLVYFRKYKTDTKSFIFMGLIALAIFWITYQFIIMWLPTMLAGDFPMKTAAREHIIEDSPVMTFFAFLIIAASVYGLYYGYKHKKPMLKLSMLSFLLIVFGFTTYTQVLIRSNSNSPMNENEPKSVSKLISYLGREQYGDQGNWPRRNDWNDENKMSLYNARDENGNYIYGEWTPPETERLQRKDGTTIPVAKWGNTNLSGDLAYLWKYQINHMYFRYFFWNYVGKISDVQDADATFINSDESKIINYKTGFAEQFPVRFFALPLLFGLLGLWYHFKRDPKTALIFLVMFLLTGVLAAIAQNQQNPQPRERDYFYAGSFLVWCMWVGMGVYALIDWVVKNKKSTLANTAIFALSIIAVPVNMAIGGWNVHSRAGNYIPFDYSYNILQSVEKDAILFTNGDNDTFPLWYLQDVEGIRRDVRVVNLSLGQTLWYIDQLKNRQPWGAKKLPLSFSDESLQTDEMSEQALKYDVGEAKEITIPVRKEILAQYTNNQDIINSGVFKFTFTGTSIGSENNKMMYVFYVNHKLVLDILQQTKFERPVYYASTVGPDVYVGLGRNLRYEGMAARVCPVPVSETKTGNINPDVMEKCLMNIDNSDNYSTDFKYGFKLRNLDNSKYVYYDEVHRRLIQMNYRILYMQYSSYVLSNFKDKNKAVSILNTLNKYISPDRFPLAHDEEAQMAYLYKEAGDMAKAREWAQRAVNSCSEIIANPKLRQGRVEREFDEIRGRQGVYKASAQSYMILGKYDEARSSLMALYDLSVQAYGNPAYQSEQQNIQKNIYDIAGNLAAIDDDEINSLMNKGKKDEAIQLATKMNEKYSKSQDPLMNQLGMVIQQKLGTLTGKPAVADTAKK